MINKYYKYIENGIIVYICESNRIPTKGVEITEAKHTELLEKINAKPQDTSELVYRLSNETEEYIPCERTHSETVDWYIQAVSSGTMTLLDVPEEYRAEVESKLPTPEEAKYTLDEAATILAQEVNA